MQITDVRVRKVAKEGKLKAVVSITMDDEFVVHDIKVIEGEKGLFIAMPSKKATDGEYRDIAHPINSATRERIQTMILEQYEEALKEDTFEEAGINQVKYTLKLVVEAEIILIISGKSEKREVSAESILAQTVVSGKIPDAYIGALQ